MKVCKKDLHTKNMGGRKTEKYVHKIYWWDHYTLNRNKLDGRLPLFLDSPPPFFCSPLNFLNCLLALLDFHLKSLFSLILFLSLITISPPLSCPATQWDVINCEWVRLLASSSSNIWRYTHLCISSVPASSVRNVCYWLNVLPAWLFMLANTHLSCSMVWCCWGHKLMLEHSSNTNIKNEHMFEDVYLIQIKFAISDLIKTAYNCV